VKPKSLRGYFNPNPGLNEMVTLPLEKKKTKIELSVSGIDINMDGTSSKSGKSKKSHKSHESKKKKGDFEDKDKFEIRVSEGLSNTN
jgi:hypothetical protein